MSATQGIVPNLMSKVLVFLGAVLVAAYVVYLPMPEMFQAEKFSNLGIVLYGLATAGSAFVAWGLILAGTKEEAITRQQVYRASAVGLALLGFMRLVTAIFPPEQFMNMLFLPIGEFIGFTALAIILYKSS